MTIKFQKHSKMGGLMISRKEGQGILINHGELRIEIVEVRGKYVRLAFKGSKEIQIGRAEAEELKAP